MKTKLKNWQILVIVICSILGTLMHFAYDWSNENYIVGLFSATNESTWEHLKLAFYPMLLMAVIGKFIIGKYIRNYWAAQTLGIISTLSFIVVAFYTYTGVLGKSIDLLNIVLFYIGIILGEGIVYKISKAKVGLKYEKISIIVLVCIFLSFVVFTYNPISIGLFKDPLAS